MSELTTAKVHRQFRSLRSKCVALNAIFAPPKPAVSVTYGKSAPKNSSERDERPPLAILQSLDKLSTRLHFDRAIVETMQLSKRIYEVRDAFRHIVQSAFGTNLAGGERTLRILSLTAICARVVGEHVQSEVAASMVDHTNTEYDTEDMHMRTQALEELYEEVPPSYRHYTLVAHALTYILETCPDHPTLLHSLLEVCISHNLISEAHTILSELFNVSIQPRPHSTSPCPLTHPAHKNFLTTLRDTCTASEHPSAMSFINSRTFVRILVDAFTQRPSEQFQVWTSQAVTRLARDLRRQDFVGSFIPLCAALARTLAKPDILRQKASVKNGNAKNVDDAHLTREDALERLAKWVVSMLDTLRLCTSTDEIEETYCACVDFLVEVEPYHLHLDPAHPTSPAACLTDALCCLATYCLASPHALPVPIDDLDQLTMENLLRSAHTTNDTFDGLVSYTFPHPSISMYRVDPCDVERGTPTPPLVASIVGNDGLTTIDFFAVALRARGLSRCEVVLYHQTLRHVEDLIFAPTHAIPPRHQLQEKMMYELRLQLMDRVEQAERRCYGGAPSGGRGPQPPNRDGEWQWEELVGSWVLKSPAPPHAQGMKDKNIVRASKRRKVGDASSSQSQGCSARRVQASREDIPGRSDSRTPPNESSGGGIIPYVHPRGLSESRKRKASDATMRRLPSQAATSSHNKENHFDSDDDISADTPVPKRAAHFTNILADAHTNVISLRAEREAKAKAKMKSRVSAPVRVFVLPESPAASVSRAPPSQLLRRQSTFATALADSHRTAICLREERARERERAETARQAKIVEQRRTRPRQMMSLNSQKVSGPRRDAFDASDYEPESSPVRGRGVVEPSSDDALNLFAYPDSSPVRSRVAY